MAGTISGSGTFTGLSTNLAAIEDIAAPSPGAVNIHPNDLQTVPDEIRQTIRVFQDGWGAQIGAGKRLCYWCTAVILQKMLQTYIQQGAPRSGDDNG